LRKSIVASKFTELIVEAVDPARLAQFWMAALGWAPTGRYNESVESGSVIEISDPVAPGPSLVFVPVPEPKVLKNRLHLDLNPVGCDQDQEVARLIDLGARRTEVGPSERTWVVLADPEGNEFCVLGTRLD
jgi:hypothetical protein